jgi:putative aldouronate transport system substrate-binding protein
MLLVRQDWVEKLLDGDTLPTLDTGVPLTKAYSAFGPESVNSTVAVMNEAETGTTTVTKKHTANIITTQNALTTMNGSTLVKALRDYIDATYNGVYGTKRSQLFCGYRSAYDVDELVALYRCVKTNGAFLTGDATKATEIVPLYPRENTNDRTGDLWRLTQFFGVRGGESRKDFLYVGSDGKLVDARGNADMQKALGKLHEMYQEGLILKEFTSKTTGSGKFENYLQKNNLGFSTYDYDQTQTVYNDPENANHPSGVTDYLFTSILPAVADWRGDGKYFHYTESWRSVKTEGWFITADTAKDASQLSRSLALFDYLYSDEGNRLMSYGPDGYLAKNSDGTIKTMAYQGKQVPVLSDDCKKELKELAAGNYTNYYRYWLGATYPVGYVKQQGMEYQTVQALAQPGLDDINNAIALGVLQHVNFKSNTDHFYDIVPTTLAFNEAEQTQLNSNFANLSSQISNDKSKSNVWSNIVMEGFGTYNTYDYSDSAYLNTVNTTLNLTGYVAIQNAAFARM